MSTATSTEASTGRAVSRFVSRYFVGQESNGDPIVDQVLWEQNGDTEPVAVMVRGKVTTEDWLAATSDLAED